MGESQKFTITIEEKNLENTTCLIEGEPLLYQDRGNFIVLCQFSMGPMLWG